MDPTSRNRVLMIGGALIVIALLLVCGPLQDRIGSDRSGTPLPPVAAGPPEPADTADTAAERAPVRPEAEAARTPAPVVEPAAEEAVEAPAVAALPGSPDSAAGGDTAPETAADAAGAVGAAAAGTAGAAAGETETAASAPSAAAELPSVSAAPPPPPTPTPAAVFDDALAATSLGSAGDEAGVGPAGAASGRFAPPVASGGPMALGIQAAQQFAIDSSLRRPCDTPGSGCQNLVSAGGTGNPPIRPGVRPVPPPNPPVRPGTRPTP